MRRFLGILMLVLATWARVPVCRAAEPEPEDLQRRALSAEDRRFRRTVELARMLSKLGRLDEARRLYEEALLLRGDDVAVTDAQLQVLRRLADHKAQLPLYRRLVTVRPGDARLQMQMGECLWRLGRTKEARGVWQNLLRRFPSERVIYDDLIDFYRSHRELK